jgi:GAF domain-containing protein
MGTDFCEILELQSGGQTFVLRAGIGWKDGWLGNAVVDAGRGAQAGFALRSPHPVVVTDLRSETRFKGTTVLLEHGVISGVSTVIYGRERLFGILGVHTTTPRTFSEDDISFLQCVANTLAGAIEREKLDRAARQV